MKTHDKFPSFYCKYLLASMRAADKTLVWANRVDTSAILVNCLQLGIHCAWVSLFVMWEVLSHLSVKCLAPLVNECPYASSCGA